MSDIHTLLARGALALGLAVVVAGAAFLARYVRHWTPRPGTDVFLLAEGRWAWTSSDSGCAGETHTISFSDDRKVMTLTNSRPFQRSDGSYESVTVYDILSTTTGSIRGAIRGEQRLTDSGIPVVWDLEMRAPDRYAWHQSDRPSWERTAEIMRCRNPDDAR